MLTLLLIIFLTISLFIILVNITFSGLFPKFDNNPSTRGNKNDLSVIIACKNEEENLPGLFSSIKELDYPTSKFEVILVDDNSTDNTYQKAVELANESLNFRILKAEYKRYPGKKGALDYGIANAKNSFILISDADCIPSKNWLAGYSEKFNEGYDLLFGLAPFKRTENFINNIACFENLRSSILNFSLAKIRLPYSAAARNFGFTISAFNKLGGFSNTLETQSGDDDLLIREAVKSNMKIGAVEIKDSSVFSLSKNSIKDYINQKARHTKTSLHYLPKHQIILGLWHSINILMALSIIFFPIKIWFALPFLIKFFSDLFIVKLTQKRLKYNFNVIEILFFQFIYEVLLVINFFSSFRKTVPWKN